MSTCAICCRFATAWGPISWMPSSSPPGRRPTAPEQITVVAAALLERDRPEDWPSFAQGAGGRALASTRAPPAGQYCLAAGPTRSPRRREARRAPHPALERLGVGVQHARTRRSNGPSVEGEERPVAGPLQVHRDGRFPRLRLAATASGTRSGGRSPAPSRPTTRADPERPACCGFHGKRALHPLREPADQLLGHRPAR